MSGMKKVLAGDRDSKMDAKGRRSRGRPENTQKLPVDFHQHIWVAVECQRWRMRDSSGRLGAVSQACRALVRGGGVNFIVGGDTRAISRAVKTKKSSKPLKELRRVEPKKESGRVRLVNAPGSTCELPKKTVVADDGSRACGLPLRAKPVRRPRTTAFAWSPDLNS